MKIRYVGREKAVQIAATRQWAERGKQIEVDSKVAKELLKQSSWVKVTTAKEEKE